MKTSTTTTCISLVALLLVLTVQTASARTLRERLRDGRAQAVTLPAPAGMRVLRDIAYGDSKKQRFDAYLPANAHDTPVIFMVHGGGWAIGDKRNPGVVENKIAYWLPKGYAVISVNNRLVPDAAPLEQARDVARALAKAQSLAASWGADRDRFVLMGHSAGAHLVALLDSNPALAAGFGATLPRGAVSLDSAAMDVVKMMQMPPALAQLRGIYDRAFGSDRNDWIAASPFQQLQRGAPPMLIVCSSRRVDSCRQGRDLAEKAGTLGVHMQVLPEDLSHGQINHELGLPSAYTEAVARFIDALVK